MKKGRSLQKRVGQKRVGKRRVGSRGWRSYGACLALLQLAAACSASTPDQNVANSAVVAAAAPAATVPTADAKLVVVFGDSLYAGYNLGSTEGFAPVLEKALVAGGVNAHVVNAGVSGNTTADGLARLAFTLDGLARKPDLVLVGLGGNDMLRGYSPASARANLDAILKELQIRGIRFMLTGMMASPNMGPDYGAAFNAIYPDLARKYDVPLYPFFLDGVIGHGELQLTDGIHPNAQGVETVVAKMEPMVAENLKVRP